jgi:hypothetical protein
MIPNLSEAALEELLCYLWSIPDATGAYLQLTPTVIYVQPSMRKKAWHIMNLSWEKQYRQMQKRGARPRGSRFIP